jgi:inner membrane protein
MASAFGHAFTAIALKSGFSNVISDWKTFLLGIVCSILPDADVISFQFGIAYSSLWGHRGFTHSILFAFLLAIFITVLFYRNVFIQKKGIYYFLFFFLCTLSHSMLDAMTSGGLGVAFFAPFNNARYFFPWRPIRVSPIGASNFFSEWGISVLKSEALWIGIPCGVYMTGIRIVKRIKNKKKLGLK